MSINSAFCWFFVKYVDGFVNKTIKSSNIFNTLLSKSCLFGEQNSIFCCTFLAKSALEKLVQTRSEKVTPKYQILNDFWHPKLGVWHVRKRFSKKFFDYAPGSGGVSEGSGGALGTSLDPRFLPLKNRGLPPIFEGVFQQVLNLLKNRRIYPFPGGVISHIFGAGFEHV